MIKKENDFWKNFFQILNQDLILLSSSPLMLVVLKIWYDFNPILGTFKSKFDYMDAPG